MKPLIISILFVLLPFVAFSQNNTLPGHKPGCPSSQQVSKARHLLHKSLTNKNTYYKSVRKRLKFKHLSIDRVAVLKGNADHKACSKINKVVRKRIDEDVHAMKSTMADSITSSAKWINPYMYYEPTYFKSKKYYFVVLVFNLTRAMNIHKVHKKNGNVVIHARFTTGMPHKMIILSKDFKVAGIEIFPTGNIRPE
jgi:hypothetical protein